MPGISNIFHSRPAPCTRSWFAGSGQRAALGSPLLFAIGGGRGRGSKQAPCLHPGVWQPVRDEELSFELKARREHSDMFCRARGAQHLEPAEQGHSSTGLPRVTDSHRPLLVISETVTATSSGRCSFHPLPSCQSHSSMGLAADDLLSLMVQMSPTQEGIHSS